MFDHITQVQPNRVRIRPSTIAEFLADNDSLIKAILKRIDWYIAYSKERDQLKKKIYFTIYEEKCKQLESVAEKLYGKYQ